jgi:hypothetical protein
METLDASWRAEMGQRVSKAASALEGLQDRFFLRSRLCLPFAERCAKAAAALGDALTGMQAGEANDETFDDALAALEKAARALDSRSTMQGMAIT